MLTVMPLEDDKPLPKRTTGSVKNVVLFKRFVTTDLWAG